MFNRILTLAIMFCFLIGCSENPSEKIAPVTASTDFWIDGCSIRHHNQDLLLNGSIAELVNILGPYDRKVVLGNDIYVWDKFGLQVYSRWDSGNVLSLNIMFDHDKTSYQWNLEQSDNQEDKETLTDIIAARPHPYFQGELVLEGARIEHTVDFRSINNIRYAYLNARDGEDANLISIQESYQPARYAYERECSSGRHYSFIFSLLAQSTPHRIGVLTIGAE